MACLVTYFLSVFQTLFQFAVLFCFVFHANHCDVRVYLVFRLHWNTDTVHPKGVITRRAAVALRCIVERQNLVSILRLMNPRQKTGRPRETVDSLQAARYAVW